MLRLYLWCGNLAWAKLLCFMLNCLLEFSFLKECYQILMVCSELNYHISQNHIYLNRNIFCLNCHGLLVLLVRVISSLCIETHKVESAKEIKRSAKEIWDRNGMKESHEIVQVSPSRSVFPFLIHWKIFLSQTTTVHFNQSRLSYPITDDFDQKGTHRVQ